MAALERVQFLVLSRQLIQLRLQTSVLVLCSQQLVCLCAVGSQGVKLLLLAINLVL
jgi:hypothetical protein